GTLILNWLCKINSERGIGGMTVVILVNMILAFLSNTIKYFTTQHFDSDNLIKFGLLFCTVLSVLVCLTILLYKGEYRIPIRRVGLNTPY
ncbi:accessory Sec system protein translocase subunit SecY2, partial [Streptococcus pneumoniae]|nr:accessory Sec system protein translocase subunit SecY2 [Streptococcus pneumoniae]